jgi:aminoglycoside 2''-phosphotransferase
VRAERSVYARVRFGEFVHREVVEPKGRTSAAYRRRIRQAYPRLSLGSVRLVPADEGQNNDVLVADGVDTDAGAANDANDGQLIFRFPRYAEGVARLPRLIRLLRAVRSHITQVAPTTMATPDPRYVCLVPPKVSRAFVGYPRIPGEPLWRETLQAIADTETDGEALVERIAVDLATFLRALHATPAAVIDHALPGERERFSPATGMGRAVRANPAAALRPHAPGRQAIGRGAF